MMDSGTLDTDVGAFPGIKTIKMMDRKTVIAVNIMTGICSFQNGISILQ